MEAVKDMDRLKIANDKALASKLKGEKVLLSVKVNKYNERNKRQERILCITDKKLYNMKKTMLGSANITRKT